jgi:putative FmdB family regulatory protein
MPIYEYRCLSCQHVFSKLQRMSAGSGDVTCPKCSSSDVERLVSTFASSTSATASIGPAGSCGPST